MHLKIPNRLVDADWLFANLEDKDLIILDATLPKVGAKEVLSVEKISIKNARFFDIKNTFSDAEAVFPNTVLAPEVFQEKARALGIHQNSCIVIYDDLGIYSSPRAYWLFQLMGITNIAILAGGLPHWKSKNYPTEKPSPKTYLKGDVKVDYQSNKMVSAEAVLAATTNKNHLIVDARSSGRFYGTEPEPRKEVKSGHIPNSVSLPYAELFEGNRLKPVAEIQSIFNTINPAHQPFIFTCGSGITASILDFCATICGYENTSVYDGSWTEWGSSNHLPITR